MKKLAVLATVAFSMLFLACEEDVIPIPLPPPAQAVGNDSAAPPAEENAQQQVAAEKPSEPAKPAKAAPPVKEAPVKVAKEPPPPKDPPRVAYYSGDAEQLSRGRYVIQVSIVPTEASARRIIKKLSDDGIKAYNAKVDNPDPEKGMIGTYNRVRIGFFDAKPAAEAFAKSRLEPLGYRWWVDRSRNDNIGKLTDSGSEPFVVEKRPEKTPKQMTEQERKDAERAAAIAAAKEEYKAIAKAANASVSSAPVLTPPKIPAKADPPPPVIKTPSENAKNKLKKFKKQ
ncbi:MAG: SPOR domain-containing protein [Fibromonadaceae bacterium]|jgi:hypothetical protein|nr:SPOR domain-containing protein [Fibromonadaceae bacterium]